MRQFTINDFRIEDDSDCNVIAEIGHNHQGSLEKAKQLMEEAGFPPGVINFIPGSGGQVGNPVMASPHLAGIHFTGSTPVFQGMWKSVSDHV